MVQASTALYPLKDEVRRAECYITRRRYLRTAATNMMQPVSPIALKKVLRLS
jgi:hypothetical protein